MLNRLLSLAVVVVCLSACSSFSLLYSFADSYIVEQADTYLSPDEEDAAFIERRTAAFLKWHTKTMLPRYARAFQSWADGLKTVPLERGTTTKALEELRALVDELIIGGAPYGAEILTRHTSPEKLAKLAENLDEKMTERREEMDDSPAERAEERVEDITDNVERITGTLNDKQVAIIAKFVAATSSNGDRWLENRAKRQTAFLAFLANRPDKQQLSTFLVQIALRPHEITDPEYREISEQRWRDADQLMFDVLSTLDDVQRRDAIKNMRDYAADMLEVAARAIPP